MSSTNGAVFSEPTFEGFLDGVQHTPLATAGPCSRRPFVTVLDQIAVDKIRPSRSEDDDGIMCASDDVPRLLNIITPHPGPSPDLNRGV
jgi:hypothetical protein